MCYRCYFYSGRYIVDQQYPFVIITGNDNCGMRNFEFIPGRRTHEWFGIHIAMVYLAAL